MRKVLFVLSTLAALLFAVPAAVDATPPADVVFEVPTVIPPEGPPTFGPFVASGPAVDAGLMCPSGETVDLPGTKVTGFLAPTGINIQLDKHFVCDDGSGDFVVKLQVRIDARGDNFNWTVVDGSGAYVDLHGSGRGVGLPICGDDCVFDIYDGKVHID